LSGSRRNVDETWMGGVIARVRSSIQPSAWALMLSGLTFFTSMVGGSVYWQQ